MDPGACWQAIYSRDVRFDGRFFAGATTTGLYCRNVCPVPFAKPENIVLFACAAAAESDGFRPCKRCQPQAAPGTPAWIGTSAVVSRAVRLILEGALDEGGVEDLSARLGLGSRHLRRLFERHLGASPLKIATTHRIHLARELIRESTFPMGQIAFCSGFKSVREFNHAVRLSTGQSPSELRRSASAVTDRNGLELRLPYRAPYDWDSLVAFLAECAIPGVELVGARSYQRTIEIGGVPGFFMVTPDEAESRLLVHLQITNYQGLAQTVERIRRIFDLGADPVQIASHLSRDRKLRRLVAARPGLRVPGVWDGFEAAVLAVLGQRVNLAGRLVRMFGARVDTSVRGLSHLFPRPEVLAVADLRQAGLDEACAGVLRRLAGLVMRKEFTFSTSRTLEETVSRIRAVCGLDESMANYLAMRAFGEPDAFPSDEFGIAERVAEKWRPWRAYAGMQMRVGRRSWSG